MMTTDSLVLVLSSFLACAVEAVEALTVVLAVGVARGFRAPLLAVACASFALAAIVIALGPALARLPIDSLRLFVGALILIFGLGWLRKAILRASGHKALRDEAALYRARLVQARQAPNLAGAAFDWVGFLLAFKAVFLEGLEVAFIVLTFGGAQHRLPLAAAGALAALILVAGLGLALHRPLSRVPENSLKFAVGLLLCSFGVFWSAEGAGVAWPGADLSLVGLLGFFALASCVAVAVLRRTRTLGSLVSTRSRP